MFNRHNLCILFICFICLFFVACTDKSKINEGISKNSTTNAKTSVSLKSKLINKYKNEVPKEWGEKVTVVKTHLATNDKVVALTFDACGGKHGSDYDADIINYLIKKKIPATLFINSRWIDANYARFISLSKNPLFEIENHGLLHRPLSVNGKSIYKIKGTSNVGEAYDEILLNQDKIYKITGKKPIFFRSGTAYYDETAVKIANEIGENIAGFSILGDAGATFSKKQVENACLKASPGSIIILHMNRPNGDTAEGIMLAIPKLQAKGYKFVKLHDYKLK